MRKERTKEEIVKDIDNMLGRHYDLYIKKKLTDSEVRELRGWSIKIELFKLGGRVIDGMTIKEYFSLTDRDWGDKAQKEIVEGKRQYDNRTEEKILDDKDKEADKMKKIFFNIDTQKDFMNKDGALYVRNAESIKDNLKKLTNFAVNNNLIIFNSMDTHYGTDKYKDVETELKRNGGIFPDHCMVDTDGQKRIEETTVDRMKKHEINIQKQTYDVFSVPETKDFLKQLDVKEAIVYGVATDYCVKAAVLGMLKMRIKVTVVKDAIMGVDEKTTKDAIKDMREKGAIFTTIKDILK